VNQSPVTYSVITTIHAAKTAFLRAALNAGQYSEKKADRLSNVWIVTNGRKICPDFYTIPKII